MTAPAPINALPDVSFAIASYNAIAYLEECIDSALAQQNVSVEVLIVDDGSSDGSLAVSMARAASDPRIRVFQTSHNMGPGGARNVAIEYMRGQWYAVLDSDDLIEPGRSAALVDTALQHDADLIADDLVIFGDGLRSRRFVADSALHLPDEIGPQTYFSHTQMFGKGPNLGFLKPMIRRETLQKGRFRYRADLRIGEDDELVTRMLLAGCHYRFTSEAGYRYRKHGNSISHRLSLENAERMMISERAVRSEVTVSGQMSPDYAKRFSSIESAVAFTRCVEALKRRDIPGAAASLARKPSAIRHFSMPIAAAVKRLIGGKTTG